MTDDVASSELPRAFGDYTLLKPLGRGGMGQVFLARLRARGLAGVDKICVVKTLRSTNDPEYERRFIDEARLIVLLSHRNICPVFDAGCFEGQYYLALEHIAGREVRQLQTACEARGAPLPVAVVIHIIKETLEALDAAHRMVHPLTHEPLRVVHRDVSPQNVMISHEGEVKLIDFGLAVSSQKVEQTAPQVVMGKMAYMAPEQARGEAVDARVDQFAAGIMLYELLTNARYYGDLAVEAMWRMSGVGGHRPARLPSLDDDLREIVLRATAPRRDDRYPTCADMRDALTAAELRRGTVAGSREVRAALMALDGGSSSPVAQAGPTPSTPAPTPAMSRPAPAAGSASPPSPAPSATTTTKAPRERTRTFRLVAPAGERTEVGVVEGLEPGSLITSEEHWAISSSSALPTETQTSLSSEFDTDTAFVAPDGPTLRRAAPPPAPMPTAPTEASASHRAEPTVIVRQGSPSPAPASPPTRSRLPIAVAAGAVLVGVVGLLISLRSAPPMGSQTDAGTAVGVVGVVAPPLPDAGVLVDAGSAGAGLVVDAGSEADAGAAADVGAGRDAGVETPPPERTPRPRPRPVRQLPPWPTALQEKTVYLSKHCGHLACARGLYGAALKDKLVASGRAAVEVEADKCFQRCR